VDNQKSDFEELFACLTARNVRFVVVGGHALAYHGRPRYTKALDVFVEPSPENAAHLLLALEDFGFGGLGLTAADFDKPGKVVQLGVAPNRVDLLTSIDGVPFDKTWGGRVVGRFGSESVPFLGRRELLANKRAVGRLQDLADIEALGSDGPP
jgi:hypothetical protein